MMQKSKMHEATVFWSEFLSLTKTAKQIVFIRVELQAGLKNLGFYRAMHFSTKRVIVIACRRSVRDVGGSGFRTT